MFPEDNMDQVQISEKEKDIGRSFKFDYASREFTVKDGKVSETDRIRAIKQWITLMLLTPPGKFKIYEGSSFGINLNKYVGFKKSNLGFVKSELGREISEQITDNRAIAGIRNFSISDHKDRMEISFIAVLKNQEEIEVSEIV